MIIGKIKKNEKKVKLDLDIYCTNCGKKVPEELRLRRNTMTLNLF